MHTMSDTSLHTQVLICNHIFLHCHGNKKLLVSTSLCRLDMYIFVLV